MQTRIGFNAGELAAEMACRVDVEPYMRGCTLMENWELSQMGAIKRRRGMRYLCEALSIQSVLVPYVYTHDESSGGVYLIELSGEVIRVLSMQGGELARFAGDDYWVDPAEARWKQINNLLLLTSSYCRPMVIKRDDQGAWVYEPWVLKSMPWRYNELREMPITIDRRDEGGNTHYDIDFGEMAGAESSIDGADSLRASYWMESQQVYESSSSVWRGITIIDHALPQLSQGARIARSVHDGYVYYACKQQWSKTDNYVEGIDDPENYPDNFERIDDGLTDSKTMIILSLAEAPDISKGMRIALTVRYWEYYTCIRDYDPSRDEVAGSQLPEEYPLHFVRGLPVGEAASCRGKWSFNPSGVWYGEYEVRRHYESAAISDSWEDRGSSASLVGAAQNATISGDESEEECWLRLFVTRSRTRSLSDIAAGFPPDASYNHLLVDGYKKHLTFAVSIVEDAEGEILSHHWVQQGAFPLYWQGLRRFEDWSWAAYSDRYGYPQLCEIHMQRLVFASTREQAQTIWMSRVDDLTNFMLGETDDSALELTMATSSQNAISWIMSQNYRLLLGTAEAEWAISAGQSQGVLTPANAQLENYGYVGSDRRVLSAVDRLLYVERGAGRVYEYGYSIEADGYRSKDLTVFAPHVLTEHGGAVSATLLRKPDTTAVFALADGQLALMTYNSFHNVNAWHRWITAGQVLSVCALPDGREPDKLYVIVQREEGLSIEVMDEYSGYTDGMHDYASTMVTNALSNPMEQPVGRAPQQGTAFCFGAAWDAEGVEITRDGVDWMQIARSSEQVAGWHELIAPAKWQYDNTVGLRLSGDRGIHILALQG